jgi:hypothetical protein
LYTKKRAAMSVASLVTVLSRSGHLRLAFAGNGSRYCAPDPRAYELPLPRQLAFVLTGILSNQRLQFSLSSWPRRIETETNGSYPGIPPRAGGPLPIPRSQSPKYCIHTASTLPGDPVAPRLIELAEKMEGDAIKYEEEEACLLLAEQAEDATGGSLPA